MDLSWIDDFVCFKKGQNLNLNTKHRNARTRILIKWEPDVDVFTAIVYAPKLLVEAMFGAAALGKDAWSDIQVAWGDFKGSLACGSPCLAAVAFVGS